MQIRMSGWLNQLLGMDIQNQGRVLPVSIASPTEAPMRRACRLLAMIHELHKAGYQRLRIAPGMSPSGCHWRCHITSSDNVLLNGWEPIRWEVGVANYTTGEEDLYFGWPDGPGKTARELARMFIKRFPELAASGSGRDRAYAGWFVDMLGHAENGRLPVFFADYALEPKPEEMPPPPFEAQVKALAEGNLGTVTATDNPAAFFLLGPVSKQVPVYEVQAKFLAGLIRTMERATVSSFGVHRASDLTWEFGQTPAPWDLPEVMAFIHGAMACGFVCTDYGLYDWVDLARIQAAPEETVRAMDSEDIRKYIHTLQRGEKWSECTSSPILQALASGALQHVADRLETDESLYLPHEQA